MALVGALAAFSFIAAVLLVPPYAWQCWGRNYGQAFLLFWLWVTNMFTFLHILIWSGSDFALAWDGKVYCDIVARADTAIGMGKLSAVWAIFFTLNEILRLKNPAYIDPQSVKRKWVNLLICLGPPTYSFFVLFFFMAPRYTICRYYGCRPLWAPTVVTFVFNFLVHVVILVPCIVYALLTVYNYFRKKRELENILQCTNTNMSFARFSRVLIFALIVFIVLTPLTIYIIVINASMKYTLVPLNFLYSEQVFQQVIKYDSGIDVLVSRIINTALSYVAIVILGTGSDAMAMYKKVWNRVLGKPNLVIYTEDAAGPSCESKYGLVDTPVSSTHSVYNAKNLNYDFAMTPTARVGPSVYQ